MEKGKVNSLNTKVSQHANDIIQKYASGLFRNATLEFYGIKTPKIKELINVELPIIEVGESSSDFIFLLEDNSYLHFEFQTTYNKSDLTRFAYYDLRLFECDGRNITTVIIYPSGVKKADTELNIGSLLYNPNKIMMIDYNGNAIYEELENKIRDGNILDDVDMLKLIFLPLMKTDMSRDVLTVNSIKLAQTIPDSIKRNACIAADFAFGSKYLTESDWEKIKEVIKMTDLATMLIEDAIQDDRIEIAKSMLKDKANIDFISKHTKLGKSIIQELQEELITTIN